MNALPRAEPVDAADGRVRVVIEGAQPGGRRRTLCRQARRSATRSIVEADCFADGHDVVACSLLWRPAGEPGWRSVSHDAARQRPLARELRRRRARAAGATRCAPGSTPSCRGGTISGGASTSTTCALAALTGAALIGQAAQRAGPGSDAALLQAWAQDLQRAAQGGAAAAELQPLGWTRRAPRSPRAIPDLRHARTYAHRAAADRSTASARASPAGTSSSRARPRPSRRGTAPLPTAKPGCPTSPAWASTCSTCRRSIRSAASTARAATTRCDPTPRRPGQPVGDRRRRGRAPDDPAGAGHARRLSPAGAARRRARHRDRAGHRLPVRARPSLGARAPAVVPPARRRQHPVRREPAEEVPGHLPLRLRERRLARRCGRRWPACSSSGSRRA